MLVMPTIAWLTNAPLSALISSPFHHIKDTVREYSTLFKNSKVGNSTYITSKTVLPESNNFIFSEALVVTVSADQVTIILSTACVW